MTLFVQAGNFFIAYGMLDRLLMRPAVAMTLRDRKELEHLQESNKQEVALLERYQQEKEGNWQACRQYFKTHGPPKLPSRATMREEGVSIMPEEITEKKLQALITQIAPILARKIQHEH